MLKRIARVAVPALFLALAVSARADDAAKAPQPFMRASVASTDRIKQAVADLGIPIPVDIAQMIEAQFPFIGAGGLDGTKPTGILFLAGEGLSQQQMVLFAFPVNAGKATVENLAATGATAVPGEADSLQLGDATSFRRTADYLLIYPGAAAVLKPIANAPFAKDYKDKDGIAHVEIDGATLRSVAPKMYKQLLEAFREKAKENTKAATSAAEARGQEFGRNMIMGLLEKADNLTLALDMSRDSIRLATSVSPSPMKGSREFPKPVFAPGAIVTGHFAYPDAAATGWLSELVKLGLDAQPDAALTADQQAAQRQAGSALADALVGDAQSFAVESHDGHFSVTVVNQYQRDIDLPALLKKSLPLPFDKDTAGTTVEDWKGPDGSVGVQIKTPKSPQSVLVIQQGKTAVITFSDQEVPPAPKLTLSPTEKISDLMALSVDLGAAFTAAAAQPTSPLAALPEEKRKALIDKVAGKNIKLTVANTPAGAAAVNLDIPVDLIKTAFEFLAPMMGGPGMEGAAKAHGIPAAKINARDGHPHGGTHLSHFLSAAFPRRG